MSAREGSDETNPWKTVSSNLVYENAWIRVREDQVIRPDAAPGIYGVVHFKNRAVGVLPVEPDGSVWLVGQYRYPLAAYSWEIPEGGCPEGEVPEECARRELLEETGLSAGHLEPLVTAHLSNSVSDEWGIVFRATQLVQGPSSPDGSEQLRIRRVAFEQALGMVKAALITDSLTVIALLHEATRRHAEVAYTAAVPPSMRKLELSLLDERLSLVRLESDSLVPEWTNCSAFSSITRTGHELSLVVSEASVPRSVEGATRIRALRVNGKLDQQAVGILAGLTGTLAKANVPVFAISTYDTDYLLLHNADVARGCAALALAGYAIV